MKKTDHDDPHMSQDKSDSDDPHQNMNKSDETDPHQRFRVIKGEGKDSSRKRETFEDHLKKPIKTPLSPKTNISYSGVDDPTPD